MNNNELRLGLLVFKEEIDMTEKTIQNDGGNRTLLEKIRNYCIWFTIIYSGATVGELLHEYYQYKNNPLFQEHYSLFEYLKFDLTFNGISLLILIITIIVLSVIIKKRKKAS